MSSILETDLPELQSRTQCVLIPRDPHFIFAYWDYTQEGLDRACNELKSDVNQAKLVLRLYDITMVKISSSNVNHSWDIEVGLTSKSQYIHVWQENSDYCAQLGVLWNGQFMALTRSNTVHTPPKSVSERNDLIWQEIRAHQEFQPYIKEAITGHYHDPTKGHPKQKHVNVTKSQGARTYQLSFQDIRAYYKKIFFGTTRKGRRLSMEEILKATSLEKVRPLISAPHLIEQEHPGASQPRSLKDKSGHGASENSIDWASSQAGLSSEARLKKRKFFFEIWTELLVYGRTEPDATVGLNQHGVKLNPDGTFSLRFALPDGRIPLEFNAQSADGVEQRHIYTRVERVKTIAFPKMLKEFNEK